MRSGAEGSPGGAAISLRDASLRYGHRDVWAHLDLEVGAGDCLAVLGPNGAGKTTLLKVLVGLLPLTSGTVLVDGRPPSRGSPTIGYVAQQRVFDADLPLRGRDLVQLGVDGHRPGLPRIRGRQIDAAIDAVGARPYVDAPIGLLSGGQQQRLRIAQALAGRPRLLLCDEPLVSLDPSSQQAVVRVIDEYRRVHGTTVVFVTHELNPVVEVVDKVLYVAGGRWAAGSVEQIMTTDTLSRLYGSHIDVLRVHGRLVVIGGEDDPHPHPPGHRERPGGDEASGKGGHQPPAQL